MFTSEHLVQGQVYTRAQLAEMSGISERGPIQNGVFRPRGHNSIWLFVTKNKTADRIPYIDELNDDKLLWQGQTQGRTDRLIIEHKERGLELLLFYRDSRYEHPGAGFTYEGVFEYCSHSGSGPTSFVLQRNLQK